MRHATRLALVGASALLSGCLATQSQLKHSSDMQSMQLANERAARVAADSALAQQLGIVRGSVDSLRTDLDSMRRQFGAKIAMLEDGLHFAMPVNFAFNDATVRDQDQPALQRFARIAQAYYPGSKITIEGFADPAGTQRYNLDLSRRRADAVKQYLVAQGLPTDLVNPVGYGETRLVTPGASHDEPGAELNRRAVFVIETAAQQSSVAMAPTDSMNR